MLQALYNCWETEQGWLENDKETGNEGLRKDGQNENVQTGRKDNSQNIAVHSEEVEKEISWVVYAKMVHTAGWVCKSSVTAHCRTWRFPPFNHEQLIAKKGSRPPTTELPKCSARQCCLLASALASSGNNSLLQKLATDHSRDKMRHHSETCLSVYAE